MLADDGDDDDDEVLTRVSGRLGAKMYVNTDDGCPTQAGEHDDTLVSCERRRLLSRGWRLVFALQKGNSCWYCLSRLENQGGKNQNNKKINAISALNNRKEIKKLKTR